MSIDLTPRILELQRQSASLEPDEATRHRLLAQVEQYSDDFYRDIDTRKTYHLSEHRGEGLLQHPVQEEPRSLDQLMELVREQVDRSGLNPASGGHMGYIPGGGLYTAALGDYIADVGNNYAGVFFAGPGAVRMENLLLRWMADLVGYGPEAAGNLASGGSVASLMALVAARDAHQLKGRDFERTVIYLSEQAHHCIHKAIRIAGLGEAIVRHLPLDTAFRIRPDALAAQVEADLAQGLKPWLVVATAGTTDTGAVDPLPEIADVAQRHGLWLHVDAAYGGFFALCEEGREVLVGLDRSDSIVMDPHKTLFLPYGLGAVLVKDRRHLMASHHYTASYLQDANRITDELSPADLSPELTKHFRGLRLWLPLLLHGVAPFRAALSEKILLCRHMRQRLSELPGIEVGPPPQLSVALFRHVPDQGDANAFNLRWMEEIHRDGAVFLSSTLISGVVWIRIAIVAYRSHLSTVERALDMLQRTREAVLKSW
jgi:glutamate/tyrosine decarboxylase-like PLP-dependent enzyme